MDGARPGTVSSAEALDKTTAALTRRDVACQVAGGAGAVTSCAGMIASLVAGSPLLATTKTSSAASAPRPLALASALAKVWHHTLTAPALAVTQSLVAPTVSIDGRIERLLKRMDSVSVKPSARSAVFGVGTAALVGLATMQAVTLLGMLNPMGCSLGALLRGKV